MNTIGNWVVYGGQTGNGDSEGHVYRCDNLGDTDGNENCGDITRQNVKVTIEDKINENTVNKVNISPNNLRNSNFDVFTDLYIEFTLGSELP